jgi:DNA-binding NarL/FixJ family response regulator
VGVVLLLGESEAREVQAVLAQGTQRRALLMTDHPRCATDLPRAVHEVADGGSVVHPGVVERLVRNGRPAVPGLPPTLTPRERDVLAGIATGASNHGIAPALGTTERAVEKHIRQLYGKLDLPVDTGVHRGVAAVVRYLRANGHFGPGTSTSRPGATAARSADPADLGGAAGR